MLTQEQIFGIIRHLLTTIGGALVAKGVFDESMMLEGVGAVMGLVGFVWSYVEKQKAEAAAEAAEGGEATGGEEEEA